MNEYQYYPKILSMIDYLNSLNYEYYGIIDENVYLIYHDLLKQIKNLQNVFIVQASEENKSLTTYASICSDLLFHKVTTDAVILNIGGGVVTDLGAYVASTYKRGCPFINIPTTLLAQVDAAIGYKCGINHDNVKNAIGTYAKPLTILSCHEFLLSLKDIDILNGKVEMLKMALCYDASLINKINDYSLDTVKAFNYIKTKVVKVDLKGASERQVLNYGHTIGHAIEELELLPHGISVAIGMFLIETDEIRPVIAKQLKTIGIDIQKEIASIEPLDLYQLCELIKNDKKRHQDGYHIIRLKEVGTPIIENIQIEALEERLSHV